MKYKIRPSAPPTRQLSPLQKGIYVCTRQLLQRSSSYRKSIRAEPGREKEKYLEGSFSFLWPSGAKTSVINRATVKKAGRARRTRSCLLRTAKPWRGGRRRMSVQNGRRGEEDRKILKNIKKRGVAGSFGVLSRYHRGSPQTNRLRQF